MKDGHVIEEHGSERQKKVFQLSEFKGNRTLLLSENYWSAEKHEWRMKKGVSLNTGNYKVMKQALDRDHEMIMDWLGVDYVPEDVARYTEIMELALEDEEYVVGEHTITFHNDLRDPLFFRTEHKGGEDEISLNLAHPFARAFAKADDETKELLLNVIQSYCHTKSRLKGEMYYDPKMLFNHLETDWSSYLKDTMENGE